MSELAQQAVEKARARAQTRRELACDNTAGWVISSGWMLEAEHFEDELLTRQWLTEADRDVFRTFRANLIEERSA